MKRFDTLQLEVDGGVATLWLDRPEKHHAINGTMMAELETVLDWLDTRSELRVLILTATGQESFCSGGDLSYFSGLEGKAAVQEMCQRMVSLLNRLSGTRRVVIAGVNGLALGGGCELLAYTHIRVASQRARFAFRQAGNGIVTGWGGGGRWFRLLGPAALMPLVLTAQTIDAEQARACGLVHWMVPGEQLLPLCRELAQSVLACDVSAVQGFLQLEALFHTGTAPQSFLEAEQHLFLSLWQQPAFQNVLKVYSRGDAPTGPDRDTSRKT